MRLLHLGIALSLATTAYADLVTLKNGRVINGTYLGGTARQLRVEVGDNVETIDVSDIARIEFSGAGAAARQEDRPVLRRSTSSNNNGPTIMRPDNDPPPPTLRRELSGPPNDEAPPTMTSANPIEVPAMTNFVVRMIDGVDSQSSAVGQTFNATLDQAIVVNGVTVVPRGADVVVKLVDAKESGKLTGKAGLTLSLWSVKVRDHMVDVNTQTISRESDSRGEKTAKVAGGGAVLGAVIGAVAGGGKGAAVGAAAGGAAGAGVQLATKGERVRVPSETRLTFVLDTAVMM